MEVNDYKYGFTMSLHEYKETIETLWDETKVFLPNLPSFPISFGERL